MSVGHLCNKVMNVERCEQTQDTEGSVVKTWTPKHTGIPCRIRQLSGDERTVIGREGAVTTHRIYCDSGITIEDRDRIKIDSVYYDVYRFNNPHELNRHLETDVILRD